MFALKFCSENNLSTLDKRNKLLMKMHLLSIFYLSKIYLCLKILSSRIKKLRIYLRTLGALGRLGSMQIFETAKANTVLVTGHNYKWYKDQNQALQIP